MRDRTAVHREGFISPARLKRSPDRTSAGSAGLLTEAVEELERKRAESNARADEARARRDRLNAEARTLADERVRIIDEMRDKSALAQDDRHRRDDLNNQVREAKRLREEWNRKLADLQGRVQELRRTHTPRTGSVPIWRLRKELKELEFRHMTTVLTPDAEKRLIADMQRLENAVKEQEDQLKHDPDVEAATAELEATRQEAEKHHAAVGSLAEEAQKAHESMVDLYEAVDNLRREADQVQVKLLEVKTNADDAHRAHIAAIEEVRDIEKMLYAARGGRAPTPYLAVEPPREEDFLARLKKGEKVSTEDLLELQKGVRG